MKKIVAGCISLAIFILYLAFVNYTEPTEVGIARNVVTGELILQRYGGFHITPPWTAVANIDTRPMRVCVTTAGRGFNCILVQFEPSNYKELVSVEGFRYYWWANRVSFNWGYNDEYRGTKDLLRGYAYSVKKYPFVKILREYEEGE